MVTDANTAEMMTMVLGEPSDAKVVINADRDRAVVVVTSPHMINHPLRDLHLRIQVRCDSRAHRTVTAWTSCPMPIPRLPWRIESRWWASQKDSRRLNKLLGTACGACTKRI